MKRRWLTAVFSLPVLVCGLLLCSLLHVIPGLLHSNCEMTWMYAWPQYQKVNLSRELQSAFPQYSLHLYKETRRPEEPTLDWTPLHLRGVPALFIPGNAGSHRQVRSSASIALQMHRREFPHLSHFDFFTVNLNEEFSGLFGGVLERQTKFVAACVRYILALYPSSSPSSPSSVVIVAHSMGGIVAQALFTLEDFPPSLVHTIVTLASPLARPVISLDHLQHDFYGSIAKLWSGKESVATNITQVSIAGGESDIQVPPHLTLTPHTFTPHTLSIATNAVPRNWVPADHQAVVWCRRVQLAVARALFLLQAPPTHQLSRDPQHRANIFRHLLFTGWKVAMTPKHTHMKPDLWTLVETTSHHQERPVPSPPTVTALPLPPSPSHNGSLHLLVASNTDAHHWLFACSLPPSTSHSPSHQLTNCTDLSPLGKSLPPKEKVMKFVRLGRDGVLERASHVVVIQKSVGGGKRRASGAEREVLVMEWCREKEHHLELPLLGTAHFHFPPSSHCTLSVFPIPHLREVWQGYSAVMTSCGDVRGGLLSPWYPHTPLLHGNGTGHLELSLSLQVPAPNGSSPELLVWAPHNCSLTISLSPSPLHLAGKLLVMYYPLLLPWVTAVAISAPRRQLHMELIMVAILWGSTCWGIPPSSDWESLTTQRLWTTWTPPLLHLTAHGLYQILDGLLRVLTFLIRCILGLRIRQISAALLAAVSLPLSLLCGGLGVICAVGVYALLAADHRTRRVLSLLTCLLLLSLPSLFSWSKNLHYSMQLSPDPLFWPLLLSCTLSLLLLLTATDNSSQPRATFCGPLSPSIPFSATLDPSSLLPLLLSLSLLLYAATQAHRLVIFSLISLSLTAISTLIYPQSPPQKKINNK